VQSNRIEHYFTKKDLPRKGGELDVDYYRVARRAAQGDKEALKKFFSFTGQLDGAGAEEHCGIVGKVIHIIGDDALADFLRGQPRANLSINDEVTYPFESAEYLRRHFPKCAKIFSRNEVTDWPSPNGRYAIHKVFSTEPDYHYSKVTRAEVIERATGKVLRDFTADDSGNGKDREGDILWAPDSNRFAFLAGNYPKTLTAIYQRSGEAFVKVDLPEIEAPSPADDPELKDMAFEGEYEPASMQWSKSNALTFEKSYFYKETNNSDSPRSIKRTYEITMTIGADGKVTHERKPIPKNE
jgi:hypothetical protein